jgi:hypothetical protein
MKTLNFSLPEFGNAVGTTKWAASQLEAISATLKNGKTKRSGTPCLTYSELGKDGKEHSYVFCVPSCPANYDYAGSMKENGGIISIYPVSDEYCGEWGLFPYLTPSAKEMVQNFINEVSENWLSQLEEQ